MFQTMRLEFLISLFLIVIIASELGRIETRKIQLDLKDNTPSKTETTVDKKEPSILSVIDSMVNAFNNARMILNIKTYSQFNKDTRKQSDIKLDSYKFKIKRSLMSPRKTKANSFFEENHLS
jgi:hypothetical protein